MFDKILIANRGEIACRIIATCRRLGIASVAVYSDADADALHVRRADEARRLGPAPASDSYLDGARVIAAAKASGARAIHPGYGFLSENAQFAQRCAEAGLVFVGPPVAAMQAMSSKASARELMLRSGVPVVPGYHGELQDRDVLRREAERIGYPILIKAVAGGGGKGMRVVAAADAFDAALDACRREATAAFGADRVLLERYLAAPRHIEVQVFGDRSGRIVHLYERDCSAQRRHQKVVEEALAVGLSPQQREALTHAACEAARAVGYTGAGTVEFLLDAGGHFYFIEMNTRIQVEHAVTEMITGVDLVEWQLRIAAGQPLPRSQEQILAIGHAVEARLYAELPESGFLPSAGVLRRFELPAASAQLRLETGVERGDAVGIDYDPMLAKIIACGSNRLEALVALDEALSQVRIVGVGSNLTFLRRLLSSAQFRTGGIDTCFLERELPRLTAAVGTDVQPSAGDADREAVSLAAAALWTLQQERDPASSGAGAMVVTSPWQPADGWRLNAILSRTLQFERDAGVSGVSGRSEHVRVDYRSGGYWLAIGTREGDAALHALGNDLFEVRFRDLSLRLQILEQAGLLRIGSGIDTLSLRRHDPLQILESAQSDASSLAAPMPGRIIAQLVTTGAAVTKGTPLLVMEAMKMEHTLCAPADGTVRSYRAAVGAQVREGEQLIDFEARP